MTTSWGATDDEAGQAAAGQLSFKCRVYGDRPHSPCAGTTDDGNDLPCRCRCHRRRRRVPLCGTQRFLLTMMAVALVCGAAAGIAGRAVPWPEYLGMALAAAVLAFWAFAQDAAYHVEQQNLNAYRDRLNRAHRNLILAAEEIGIKLDIPE